MSFTLLFFVLFGFAAADESCDNYSPMYRLPRNILPVHYDLLIKPNLGTFTYTGEVRILLKILDDDVASISINQVELNITEAQLANSEKDWIPVNSPYSIEKQATNFQFNESLPKGEATLKINFENAIGTQLNGFYRSKYSIANGTVVHIASTKFEPTYARRAFPCFDEPALKATFNVTLIAKKELVAISNGPEVSRASCSEDESYDVIKFDTSPKMSTYLVAWAVGQFEHIEGKSKDGITVRAYVPIGKSDQGRYALEIGIKSLEFYTEYFGEPYPMVKLDMLAIPEFASRAMENYGLIMYRDQIFLVNADTSYLQKRDTALVVAHEVSHQWFGNLVTMQWWTDLWLNEGFATYMAYFFVDHLYPEDGLWHQFVREGVQLAMALDAMDNSHPIQVKIENPDAIHEVFDAISYRKSAALIRVLRDWVGHATLRDSLRLYISRHKYGNTCTRDLWAAIEDKSGLPVNRVMSTWTKQMGFPLITVTRPSLSFEVKLSQTKFMANGTESRAQAVWEIPLLYMTKFGGKTSENDVIRGDTVLNLERPLNISGQVVDWFKLNPNSIGFYRTKYSENLLIDLKRAVEAKELIDHDRSQLQSDLFAICRAGYERTTKAIDFLKAYKHETNYEVWISVANSLRQLAMLLTNTDFEDKLNEFGLELFGSTYSKISWEAKSNERFNETLLRSLIILQMGSFGSVNVIEEARTRFAEHAVGGRQIDTELRKSIYTIVAGNSDDGAIQSLIDLYKKSTSATEQARLGSAMGATRKPNQLKMVLDFALSEHVRAQDAPYIIVSTSRFSAVGRQDAWTFLKNNWKLLVERYSRSSLMSRLIKGITENFASEEKAEEVEDFFKQNATSESRQNLKQSLESIQLNGRWLARDGQEMKRYLSSV